MAGARPGEPIEFEFTPDVPSTISSPPNPVPLIQLFGPNKIPTMLLETWNNEFITMALPGLHWREMEAVYNNLWSVHIKTLKLDNLSGLCDMSYLRVCQKF
jgi:hypothetical protein